MPSIYVMFPNNAHDLTEADVQALVTFLRIRRGTLDSEFDALTARMAEHTEEDLSHLLNLRYLIDSERDKVNQDITYYQALLDGWYRASMA